GLRGGAARQPGAGVAALPGLSAALAPHRGGHGSTGSARFQPQVHARGPARARPAY
nr:hypothetical protein [Tanacetum cinerariifolium]